MKLRYIAIKWNTVKTASVRAVNIPAARHRRYLDVCVDGLTVNPIKGLFCVFNTFGYLVIHLNGRCIRLGRDFLQDTL